MEKENINSDIYNTTVNIFSRASDGLSKVFVRDNTVAKIIINEKRDYNTGKIYMFEVSVAPLDINNLVFYYNAYVPIKHKDRFTVNRIYIKNDGFKFLVPKKVEDDIKNTILTFLKDILSEIETEEDSNLDKVFKKINWVDEELLKPKKTKKLE